MLGFVSYHDASTSAPATRVLFIDQITAAAPRRGTGSALMRELRARFPEHTFELHVSRANARAKKFYRAVGFSRALAPRYDPFDTHVALAWPPHPARTVTETGTTTGAGTYPVPCAEGALHFLHFDDWATIPREARGAMLEVALQRQPSLRTRAGARRVVSPPDDDRMRFLVAATQCAAAA